MTTVQFNDLPVRIRGKLSALINDVQVLIEDAWSNCSTQVGEVRFRFESSQATRNLLTSEEQAQALFFVYRYHHLPSFDDVQLTFVQDADRYIIGNMGFYRRLINEYRSIVGNQSDSIYFTQIESLCQRKLLNGNPSVGLCLSVLNKTDTKVTEDFRQFLKERKKAVQFLLDQSDLNYLYNGVLQHSDQRFSDRVWNDYVSGTLNYTILKNALLLDEVKDLLLPHYRILNTLTFPVAGSL